MGGTCALTDAGANRHNVFTFSFRTLRMGLRETLVEFSDFLDGEEMTGRQAGLVIAFWMGFTAALGLIMYLVVFVFMGF